MMILEYKKEIMLFCLEFDFWYFIVFIPDLCPLSNFAWAKEIFYHLNLRNLGTKIEG